MNIFVEHPEKRIRLEDLHRLLVKYDKIYDSYPESYYEGHSIASFISGQLSNNSICDDSEIDRDDWDKLISELSFDTHSKEVILE